MRQYDIDRVNEPIPNMEMLDKIIDYIEAHPEEWDQSEWVSICGTKFCLAGFACLWDEEVIIDNDRPALWVPEGHPGAFTDFRSHLGAPPGYRQASFALTARHILGLTKEEADLLFDGDNDLDDLKTLVERVRFRSREQVRAFDLIFRELLESVPELAEVLKPGYLCPESREAMIAALKRFQADDQ